MERNEFLYILRSLLTKLPAEEIDSALRYYEEYLDEADDEAEAIRKLGSPEQIAARILADFEKQDEPKPLPSVSEDAVKPEKKRSVWQTIGLVFLLICASPLLISLGAAALAIALSLLAVLISVIISVIAPFFALSIAFIAAFFLLLGAAGSMVGVFTPGAVLMCGLALLLGALGIVCGIFTGYLVKWSGMLIKSLFRSLNPKKKGASAA